jgi:predicted O-methyltransferase YrrM
MHWSAIEFEHTVKSMNSTLSSPTVSAVLQRMSLAESDNDPEAMASAGTATSVSYPIDITAAERAELFKDVYMSVSSDGGRLLYLLARATGARTVVEYGTSFGVSTIHLASAVRDNGGGLVIATELQADKAAAAQRNFIDAGVDDLIDLRVGDALTTLSEVPDAVDLVLLDGWPELALSVLRLVEPHLRQGALIVVDDVDLDFGSDVHGPLLAYLADNANGYLSIKLPIGDGLQACVRL